MIVTVETFKTMVLGRGWAAERTPPVPECRSWCEHGHMMNVDTWGLQLASLVSVYSNGVTFLA